MAPKQKDAFSEKGRNKKKESSKGVFVLSLVGGFKPFEKYARQIGYTPQVGVENPKIFELPPPRNVSLGHLRDFHVSK